MNRSIIIENSNKQYEFRKSIIEIIRGSKKMQALFVNWLIYSLRKICNQHYRSNRMIIKSSMIIRGLQVYDLKLTSIIKFNIWLRRSSSNMISNSVNSSKLMKSILRSKIKPNSSISTSHTKKYLLTAWFCWRSDQISVDTYQDVDEVWTEFRRGKALRKYN